MIKFFKLVDVALDLGNSNTLLADCKKVLLSQPSCIVFSDSGQKVKAIGDQAYKIMEKAHEELLPVRPMRGGVIADFNSARVMIRELVDQAFGSHGILSGFNNIISGVPYATTEVERRALRDALDQFHPRKRFLLFEPLAAALGMDLNIKEPEGKMIIDLGGGITEIVIISLSGIVAFESIKIAGDTFDVHIQDHFRRNYNMDIGLKTAEQVKIDVGAVIDTLDPKPTPATVKGKDRVTGIPITRIIEASEVAFVLEKSISAIESAVIRTLEKCPPELAADIQKGGIHLTGGSSQLRGIKERFGKTTGLEIHLDPHPMSSVSMGIAKALAEPDQYASVLIS